MRNYQIYFNNQEIKVMNTKDKLMLSISILFLIFVILIFVNATEVEGGEIINEKERFSMGFILGKDESLKNQFYTNAESYFRYNPQGRTDRLDVETRSLASMIAKLNELEFPVGEVHIVVHSNPWSGISLPIKEGGERITVEALKTARLEAQLEPISQSIIDTSANVYIHACGLGKNRELVDELRLLFNNANVLTSDSYVNFRMENGLYKKSEMQVYYAFYPTAYKPADLHLARQLRNRYPSLDKEWLDGIQNSSYKYNIPVEWEITYGEHDLPSLDSEVDKLTWLMNQDELLEIIDRIEIPFDYFRWIVKKGEDSIKVYGKVTVLCVLDEIKV